jgi:hypothetical protein
MSNLSTALELAEVAKSAVFSPESITLASRIASLGDFSDEITSLLMEYSAHLSADVATRVISIIMPKDAISNMMNELREMGEFDGLEG